MEKSDLQRFRNECVAAHNFYRAAHGTAPLCWSSRLAESAQNWADYLASSVGGSLRYSSDKDIGENLACLWGSELNGQKVTRIWYEEGKYFDYNKPRVNSRTRSFCQVVWEGTRELGAGAAVTKHGKQIIVARYFPAVNKRDVTRNVKKARSTPENEQPLAYDTRWSRLYVGLKEFHEECLAVHNEYRFRHGAAPLQWSAELAWEAQQWAENLARSGELRHNDDDTVGENLAGMVGGELTGREATDMWYDEIEDYNFDDPGYSEDTSNFSQIVWVASESLGVGRALHDDLCVVVAFYEPPGNMEGSFGDNVLRMGSAVRQRKSKETRGFVPPTPDLESFRLEMLVTHNYFRARHGSPPLVFSGALTDEAQYWAERLLVTGAMESLDNSRIGISVAVLDKAQVSGVKVSELWYKEILSYDFDSPGFSNETLNFSQLVWQSSRKLGIGKATGVDGVTVIVARYEPVGNIDGLFVQNVKRRGHERGSCEPMIFHVEYRYRVRADSKSTTSFMSWEHEDAPTFVELQTGTVRTSDLDEFDENENILHRAQAQQEVSNNLTVSDHFTRLVWIDPNSPTLQRKGVIEEPAKDDKSGLEEDEEKEDPRTAYEQDNTSEAADLTSVTEEPLLHTEEGELEEADLFSDPEDDLHQRFSEVRRSLTLDSEGTEPDMQRASVLSKVAFFEMFQQGMETQSPSHSETLLRRSLIQEELEELASRPKRSSFPQEEEVRGEEEVLEEHECQLEFDDVFPAHREGDEEDVQLDEDIFDDEAEDEEESLVSVSETEDVLDFPDYDTRPEGLQDLEFEEVVCVTHEFSEEEQSAMEITDAYHEDISHEHPDITEEEDQPLGPTNLSTADESYRTDNFILCEDESPDLVENTPDNSREECFKSSEPDLNEQRDSFERTPDPEFFLMASKQENVEIRMKELSAIGGLSLVEVSEDASDESGDFNETMEGKLLENIVNNGRRYEPEYEETPIEETCEATFREAVESEIDFEALFGKLHADWDVSEKANEGQESSKVIYPSETVQVLSRGRESERAAKLTQISPDLGPSPITDNDDDLEEEGKAGLEVTLDYQGTTSIPARDECFDESTQKDTIHVVWKSAKDPVEPQARLVSPTPEDKAEQCYEALRRDYGQERAKALEETSLELNLVFSSSDEILPTEEHVEPLDYHQAPKSSTASEPPEILEHIDAETRQIVQSEINFEDMFRKEKRASPYMEENSCVDSVKYKGPEDSLHIAGETRSSEITEEVVEQHDDVQQTSLVMHEQTVGSVTTRSTSSPSVIAGDGAYGKSFEEMYEDVFDEVERRASLLEEEDSFIHEVEPITPSSPKHLVQEHQNVEPFEEIDEELIQESKRASLLLEEEKNKVNVQTDSPSSPKHIAVESRNFETYHELEEESIEECNRALSFLDEGTLVDEEITVLPSSPEHLAGEGSNAENFEEVEEEPTAENKRASLFIEENFAVDELTPTKTSVPIHIAGQEVRISEFVEISEEATAPLELAQEFEESDEEVNYDYAVTKTTDGNNHVAGEVTNIELREITDEEESPESDYGEQFEEFESAYRTQGLMEPTRSAHIAGEIDNIVSRDEIMEDTLQLEEGLEFEDSLQLVTTTNIEDTNQSSLHVAVELSNIEPHEESSEEEKPEKEEIAEEIEEAEVRATTVALKSPQSLLSIAAAALELKIDTTQQVSEVVETKSEVTQQHSEEKHLEVPAIFVNVADEVSDNDEESACYVEEEPNIETEIQEQFEETVVKYKTEKKPVSESHVAAEVCISEFPSKKDDVEEQTDFAEPFEESEEGSVSELMSECSSSPLHVSSELKDFQDYETTGEDYGTETYQVITFDETKFVSEKSFSKGLPSLYITEELSTQAIYDESVLNGKSVAIETTEEYKKEEKPLETETSIFVSQPLLQTVSDFSDSDYNDGVGEEDDLSEREFCEGFEEMEESGGRDTLSGEPTNAVSKSVLSESQVAEEEDTLVDATDNAQKSKEQELVSVHHYARDVERESIVHTEGKTKEDTKEIEEKGFTHQMQTFTTVSQRSVEVKSSYHVMESRESQSSELIYTGEEEQRMEISHTIEETVQVIASKTTRQVSSTDSHIATASEEIHYKADKNSEGILKEELKTVQEISFTPTKQTTRQTSWENDQHYVKNDQLSESILEKEVEDQETKKNERLLSEDETEVRLLKSEVMKSKAAEQQESLGNPHVMIERESKFVSLVHSGVKDVREVQQVIRQEDVTVILKDDEASLEEESAEEHFEEEIDIMRMDEALSEEEFRGEGAENVDHSSSRLSKTDSVEEIDRWDQEEGSKPLEDERKKHLFEEEVDVSEVQSIYEEEVEMQRVKLKEDGDPSETKDNVVSSTPTFEEEVEIAAHGSTIQAEEGSFESQTADNMQLRPQSTEFEEELEVSTLQEVQEVGSEDFDPEGHSVAAVFEEEVEISASREEYQEPMMVKDEERKTVYYIESSEQFVEEGRAKLVEKRSTRRQPLDLSQVDLYEDEGAATRYYVELSSTESLERAYEEVEDEAPFTEKFVRQGDPLEENLEEFILVRYGDEFESSGEEDLSEQREIYVIPEEDNDGENNNLVEYPKEELEIEKEPLAESFYEREYKDVGLEEIRESPEFGIDDSPEDELDEEEQRQLEEYERLESFVILEEKLSQVESDEDCDDENGGFRGEEGDENVFHSDVHSSSEETLHEDELGETMTTSSIRHAAVSADTESNEDKNSDRQSSGTHQELAEDSFVVKDDELEVQEGFAESAVKDFSSEEFQTLPIQKGILSDEGDRENVKATPESVEKEVHPESREGKDNKNEHNLSSDSSGEQSISSEGSLSSTASVDLEGLNDFEQDCLLQHNFYRRQHRCKPLKWSEELAAGAKEWAEYLASMSSLERCDGKEFGQNLATSQGKEFSGSEVVDTWYGESSEYNFDDPAFNAKCGNFTQVVWTSSSEFGVGKSVADDGTQYVVAWYKPSGNVVGEFKDNVKPPKDSSSRVRRRRSSARRRSRSGIPPSTPAEREKFKTECVISHNYYRTFHNAPPLRWSPLLAAEAQNYADRLIKTGSLTHSGQKDRGENLAYTWDSPLSARGAVDLWYDEVQEYDFDCPGYTSNTGHFTQLVWVGTEEFGMGMAVAPDGRHVVVGRYYPPGNIVGQFRANVHPREIAGIP